MFNFYIGNNVLPSRLNNADIKPAYTEDDPLKKPITDQLVYYRWYRKL